MKSRYAYITHFVTETKYGSQTSSLMIRISVMHYLVAKIKHLETIKSSLLEHMQSLNEQKVQLQSPSEFRHTSSVTSGKSQRAVAVLVGST